MVKKTSSIMTKTGDDGMTMLADGRFVSKSGLRMEAIGNVDELNSLIGLLLSENPLPEMEAELDMIQDDLFGIGAELAGSSRKFIEEKQVLRLETMGNKYDAGLPSLQGFISPGGVREAALFHFARSVCRRAERSVFALAESESASESAGKYLNRLSDVLFICARVVNNRAEKPDRLWQKNKSDA